MVTGDPIAAAGAAAISVGPDPWAVVQQAGALARCDVGVAPSDLGLTETLAVCGVDSDAAVVRVEAGAPFPDVGGAGRRARGAFDTPMAMARRVAALAVGEIGNGCTALDPACGTGAFLVALSELGVSEILGADLDPVALAVARVAAPRARLECCDALDGGALVDVVVGNPPFIPPERQDRAQRAAIRARFAWLEGRFDMVIPVAAAMVDRVRPGGVAALVVPTPMLSQPYGAGLRRRWLASHRVLALEGPIRFPGASVQVSTLALRVGGGPGPVPRHGVHAEELLRLPNAPIDARLRGGDVALLERVNSLSQPLSSLAVVDTGVVAHGRGGGKGRLLFNEPGPGRVPFADARQFFMGERRWLDYRVDEMHRPKRPALFVPPKIVVQRILHNGQVRAEIDRGGVYVGHTCTVVVPHAACVVPLERLHSLLTSPIVNGLLRIAGGERLDLYPRAVAEVPVPLAWLTSPGDDLATAWQLGVDEVERLTRFMSIRN